VSTQAFSKLPGLHDLTPASIKQGRGWFVGEAAQQNKLFNYIKERELIASFASPAQMLRVIHDELQYQPDREKSSNTTQKGRGGFYHFTDLAESTQVFRNDPKSVRKFKADDVQLKSEEGIGLVTEYDVVGDFIDIGRYLEGSPECMGFMRQGNPSGLRVTMIVDLCMSAGVDEADINHRQARMLRLVDWMEQHGVRCKIQAIMSSDNLHLDVTVKDYGDAVDLNGLAVTGHSDFFRRQIFLMMEQSKTWSYGYGYAHLFTDKMQRVFTADPADGLTVFVSTIKAGGKANIDRQFDALRDKIVELLANSQNHDFTKVYAVRT
jgi:hypothetical protein